MSGHFFNFSTKEILTPQLKEIRGIFYRIHPVVDLSRLNRQHENTESANFYDVSTADLTGDFTPEEMDILSRRVRKQPQNDAFRMILDQEHIAPALYSMIIGKGGSGKKAIEDETKARIMFPDKGAQNRNKPIEIYCHDDINLIICRRRLCHAAQTARFNIPFTHLICFPVASPVLLESFGRFRSEVIKKCGGCRGFSPDLFQNPLKLHITIGTLALFSPDEGKLARDSLEECFAEDLWRSLEGNPLKCRLKGLEIMNDDPSEVDVLYAKIDDASGRLQTIADSVYEWFMDSEPRFLQDKFDHLEQVKLHVTLLNSRFRKGEEISEADAEMAVNGTAGRRSFDARALLQHYGDFDFGEVVIKEIHISQRFSTDHSGFYIATKRLLLDSTDFRRRETPPEVATTFLPDSYSDEPSCAVDAEYDEER